jgi:hypothetical protein
MKEETRSELAMSVFRGYGEQGMANLRALQSILGNADGTLAEWRDRFPEDAEEAEHLASSIGFDIPNTDDFCWQASEELALVAYDVQGFEAFSDWLDPDRGLAQVSNAHGFVSSHMTVGVGDLLALDYERWLDLVAEYLVGEDCGIVVSEVDYEAVGVLSDGSVVVQVSGNVAALLAEVTA